MKLVVVESPAKAKTINKYLGKDYLVLASYGHIRDLPSKNGSVLPEEDFLLKYDALPKSKRHIDELCRAAKDSNEIILATDPDREGEGIAWHVVEMLKEQKKLKNNAIVKRIVFTEITKKAVDEAIKHPRDIDENLVDAQQARRALDYLVGFNLSPVLWRKLPGCKSAGRVQSVALRIVCEREKEVKHFKKEEYWDIAVDCAKDNQEKFKAKLTHIDQKKLDKFALTNEADALQVVEQMKQATYAISDVEKKQQKRNPYAPFITSTLQQDASRKLGFSTKKTMQIAQKLYEGIQLDGGITGLITYMRTDGVTISNDAISSIRDFIAKKYGDKYLPKSPRVYKSKSKNAQEAHEAIRPTNIELTPDILKSKLEPDMLKLYALIWRHTVACQMESAVFDIVTAKVQSDDKKFILSASGSTLVFKGFYEVYAVDKKVTDDDEEDNEDKLLPILEVGEKIACNKIDPKQHFTEPPPRYNEASLVKKLVELGIGRPSTYAPIISVIQDRNYVKLDDKKRFIPETQGIVANAFLVNFFNKYVEYDFTAKLEEDLDQIAEGNIKWKKLLENFWQPFKANVDSMSGIRITEVLETLDKILFEEIFSDNDKTCPGCKVGNLALRIGKYGAFYSCDRYPDCSFVMKLNSNENPEELADAPSSSDPITLNSENLPIYLKKGPYGWYLQVGDDPKGVGFKRVKIPPNIKPQDINQENALKLVALPRIVGEDDEKNQIIAAIGRFGPYLKYKDKLASLPKDENPFTIDVVKALQIIKNKELKDAKVAESKESKVEIDVKVKKKDNEVSDEVSAKVAGKNKKSNTKGKKTDEANTVKTKKAPKDKV
jgi:DNA topoisomerase-1